MSEVQEKYGAFIAPPVGLCEHSNITVGDEGCPYCEVNRLRAEIEAATVLFGRNCEYCGRPYLPTRAGQTTCSDLCADAEEHAR
jgi:hypothetical protein